MKTTMKLFLLCLMAMTIITTSCSKDGDIGPAGPAGIAGTNGQDGEDGLDGSNGQDGEDGNANVIVKTIDPFPSWETGSYLGAPSSFVEIDDPLLDENTIDNSLILVYFELFSSGSAWYPMTFNFPLSNGEDQVITFTYELNKITIYSIQSSGQLNANISQVKYFIIPANSTSGKSSGIDYKKMSYNELIKHFGLE